MLTDIIKCLSSVVEFSSYILQKSIDETTLLTKVSDQLLNFIFEKRYKVWRYNNTIQKNNIDIMMQCACRKWPMTGRHEQRIITSGQPNVCFKLCKCSILKLLAIILSWDPSSLAYNVLTFPFVIQCNPMKFYEFNYTSKLSLFVGIYLILQYEQWLKSWSVW